MQSYYIVLLGRIIGAGIMIVGTILAIWNAVELGEYADSDEQFRAFLQTTLNYLAFGGLVYLAAEILDRVRSKEGQRPPP